MIFREALISDVNQVFSVRLSVKENVLSNPALITKDDYIEFITKRGKGWVCEMDQLIAGFAIADLLENNIWALFVLPEFEGKGIGGRLHELMLDWYFNQEKQIVWLGTSPATRAERFYRDRGWRKTGNQPNGESRFEMSIDDWRNRNS